MTVVVSWIRARGLPVFGVAVTWVAFFKLNALAFSSLEHSPRAHWVFLPAAVRVISVLLFEAAGGVGLAVGAYLTLPHSQPADWPWEVLLSISSGLAPLLGVHACRRVIAIDRDLAGLRGRHVVMLSIVTAGINSLLVNSCMAAAGRWHGDVEQIATVLVGDVLGTAIVLAAICAALPVIVRLARE